MTLGELAGKLRRSLSLRTAVAMAVAIGAILVFVDVAKDVVERETEGIDQAIALAVHRRGSAALDAVMRAVTTLGSAWVVIGVVTVVTGFAWWRRERGSAGVLVAVSSVAEGLNALLKLLFRRNRPALFPEIPIPDSYSFPSGHAMVATAAYGMAAIVIARLHPRATPALLVATPLLVLLIGVSRVYLGVHWPTDVVAGFAAGAFLLVAGEVSLGRVYRPRER